MNFDDYLRTPSSHATAESHWISCKAVLVTTGAERQFAINFHAESHLSQAAWHDILGEVFGCALEAVALRRGLTAALRRHTLTGKPIDPPPAPLGRAVAREIFVEFQREQFDFNTPDEAEQFMDDILREGATVETNRDQLSGRFLAREKRAMWATFDVTSGGELSGEDPFDHMPAAAADIRAQLGLSHSKEDLLLFVYALPAGVTARFPTIADAYAGDEWTWYFRPAGSSEPWGMTMTWSECSLPPRPELVHEAITGDNLVAKIRLAK